MNTVNIVKAGVFFMVIAICGCSRTEIIAHRGSSFDAPENTVAAAQLAWEQGCRAVEIDVFLTGDGRVMVMHDRSAMRTTGADMDIETSDSLSLSTLDAGRWKGEAFAGEKVPFVEEIIEIIPPDGVLFVELKTGVRIVPVIAEIVRNSLKSAQICFISFDLEAISAIKKMMPQNTAYWLRSSKYDEQRQMYAPHGSELIDIAKEHGLDGLNVSYRGVTEAFCKQVKAAGLGMYVWTVDDCADAKRMKNYGVQGIATNRPVHIKECLGD